MTDLKPPELFAERPVRSDFARHSVSRRGPPYAVRRFLTVCVLIALIGGGLYWAFAQHTPSIPGQIPTLKAEGPYKQRPDQPGGIDIPHQDVQVYQELDGNGNAPPQVEHLLPPPETPQITKPIPSTPLQNATATQPPTSPQIESLAPPSEVSAPPAPVPAAAPLKTTATQTPDLPVKKPTQSARPAQAPAPTMSDVIKDVTAQAPQATPAPVAGGTIIQLASLPDEATAQSAMKKLQVKYASVLGANQLHLVRADLGSKGVYYRVQSQKLSDDQAKNICAAIRGMNAGCILVRP